MLIVFGIVVLASAVLLLYLKYRVVLGGDKCKATIVDVASRNGGYVVGSVQVRKKAFIVKINNRKYYTAHGCIFEKLGKQKIGKEITVCKKDKYGNEVFKMHDYRIEIVSLILMIFSIFLIRYSL